TSDCRNRVKIQNQKYFALPEAKSPAHYAHPVPLRGVSADRHDEGRGCGGREVRKTVAHDAYGKSVWSRRRGAGVNASGGRSIPQGATEAKEPFSGESTL